MMIDDSFRSLLKRRKTVRKQQKGILSNHSFRELVWAAYGQTHDYRDIKMRTAPSAGATYPVELYFICEDIEKAPDGIYRYDTTTEDILPASDGKFLRRVQSISLDQQFISQCNVAIVLAYNPRKIVPDYGPDSFKYAALECGHIAQNLLLMATSLDLAAVPVGAFDAKKLGKLLGIEEFKEALYMVTVGIPA
jgi:SagB-type dehydrogenase family enzyme